jgi:tyrosine-protein kinase Etk/Wzc
VKVSNFEVPPSLLGAKFVVTKIADQRFRLQGGEVGLDAKGEVGSELRAATSAGLVKIKIDQLPGDAGSQFFLRKDPRVLALENLRTTLSVSELGKDSGMLSVSLTDSSPEKVKAILNEKGAWRGQRWRTKNFVG